MKESLASSLKLGAGRIGNKVTCRQVFTASCFRDAGVDESMDAGRGCNSVPHYTALLQRCEVCPYAGHHASAA